MKRIINFLGFVENSAFILKNWREYNEKCNLSLFSQYFLLWPNAVISSLFPPPEEGPGFSLLTPDVRISSLQVWDCSFQWGGSTCPNAQNSSLTRKPGCVITSEKPACSFQNAELSIYHQNFVFGSGISSLAVAFLFGFPFAVPSTFSWLFQTWYKLLFYKILKQTVGVLDIDF